jgi:3-phosphoshikimate 1-carboxyvinyltransferase
VPIHDDGQRLIVEGRPLPTVPFYRVPGDPSAASCVVATRVLRGGALSLPGICLNPTRTGFFALLAELGVPVVARDVRDEAGEPVGTLAVGPAPREIPSFTIANDERFHALIDEVPLAAALATRAAGRSSFLRAGELTFKETDRLASTRAMLAAFGAEVEVSGDALHVRGGRPLRAGVVPSAGDHRIAMAATALAASLPGVTRVEGGACVESSFPGFCAAMRAAGCDVREVA